MAPRIIFVNGNIGAGKETIILHIQEVLSNHGYGVKVALEPVSLWRESGMLDRLYGGEYLEFQMYAITTRINEIYVKHQEALMEGSDFLLVETNPLVDLNVYAKTNLTEMEFLEYKLHWNREVRLLKFNIAGCINLFLSVPPEVSASRITTRARNEESAIELSYLRKLYYSHLIHNENVKPLVVIYNNCAVYDNFQLKAFIDCLLQ